MYQKYTTEAFLVFSRYSKEADCVFLFYTKEFGMISTVATSVRLSKSKLRPHIIMGTPLLITIIKSKSSWRLVEVEMLYPSLNPLSPQYASFAKILSIEKNLILGEEKNESLFDVQKQFWYFLKEDNSNLFFIGECVCVSLVLSLLGYGQFDISKFPQNPFDPYYLKGVLPEQKEIIEKINKALKSTGL